VIERQSFVIDPKQMQQCSVEIVPWNWTFDRFPSDFIRRSDSCATFDSGASEPARESITIVIATRTDFVSG